VQEQEVFSIDMHATSGTFGLGAGGGDGFGAGGGDGFGNDIRGILHDDDDQDEEPPVEQEKPERQPPPARVGALCGCK
jgi:hypothetical protein